MDSALHLVLDLVLRLYSGGSIQIFVKKLTEKTIHNHIEVGRHQIESITWPKDPRQGGHPAGRLIFFAGKQLEDGRPSWTTAIIQKYSKTNGCEAY